MSARMFARLLAAVAGAALWGGALAPPVLAFGQVVVFRDAALYQKYMALEGKMTKLQIQHQAEQLSARMRGKRLYCKGIIQDVLPPEITDPDPNTCKVVVALVGVTGFTTPELPTVTFFVPKARALALRQNGSLLINGKLYAIDRYGAVAIELDAPPGWRDPLPAAPAGGQAPGRGRDDHDD
jgi:hypothetical protein